MRSTKSYSLAKPFFNLRKMRKRMLQTPEAVQRRSAAARENGSYGGEQRARDYGPEVLSEWAAWGGNAVLAKYGRQYFSDLRKRRKNYPKYSMKSLEELAADQWANARKTAAMAAAKNNGRRGGYARAKRHSAEERSEWAQRGGKATHERYGNHFYRKIRKLRKTYRKGYLTKKSKERHRKWLERLANTDPGFAPICQALIKK
jgi:hypothetical protein